MRLTKKLGDTVGKAGQENVGEAVATFFRHGSLMSHGFNNPGGNAGKLGVDSLDEAHEEHLHGVDLVFQQRDGVSHDHSLPAVVGASQGKAQVGALKGAFASPRPEAPILFTTWSTLMRKFIAACHRLDDHWLGDLIAAICLFALVPLILFIGTILDGGM